MEFLEEHPFFKEKTRTFSMTLYTFRANDKEYTLKMIDRHLGIHLSVPYASDDGLIERNPEWFKSLYIQVLREKMDTHKMKVILKRDLALVYEFAQCFVHVRALETGGKEDDETFIEDTLAELEKEYGVAVESEDYFMNVF